MADKSGWTTSDGKVITEVVVDNPEIDRASADISLAEPEDAPASLEHGTYRGDIKAQLLFAIPGLSCTALRKQVLLHTCLLGRLSRGLLLSPQVSKQ